MAPVPYLAGDEARHATPEPPVHRHPTAIVDQMTLTCSRCEVTWHGRPWEPCWSCGAHGRSPAGTTLVRD